MAIIERRDVNNAVADMYQCDTLTCTRRASTLRRATSRPRLPRGWTAAGPLQLCPACSPVSVPPERTGARAVFANVETGERTALDVPSAPPAATPHPDSIEAQTAALRDDPPDEWDDARGDHRALYVAVKREGAVDRFVCAWWVWTERNPNGCVFHAEHYASAPGHRHTSHRRFVDEPEALAAAATWCALEVETIDSAAALYEAVVSTGTLARRVFAPTSEGLSR